MVANLVLRFDVVLLHLLQGEPHRVLVVGRHHHPDPLWEGESTASLNLVSIKHKQRENSILGVNFLSFKGVLNAV